MKPMKHLFGMCAVCALMAVGTACSSDNDEPDSGMELTYAADDFVMTERNFREKLIGEWEITELVTSSRNGYTKRTADDFGSLKNVTFRADGSCSLMTLANAHYRVGKDTVVISCDYDVWIIGENSTDYSAVVTGEEYKEEYDRIVQYYTEKGYPHSVKQLEFIRLRITAMEKDYFAFVEPVKAYATTCKIRRRK